MAYDTRLAARVATAIDGWEGAEERRMFGGLAYLVRGHMCCGIVRDMLVLRLGASGAELALKRPHTKPMDFTGKPMKGMVYVTPAGLKTAGQLQAWLEEARAFCETLPAKQEASKPAAARKHQARLKSR